MSESNEREGEDDDGTTDDDRRRVTVRVVGEGTHELRMAPDATCADLLRAVDLNPHVATALVDGRPVPSDATVPAGEVRVLRLVKGG